VLHEQGVDVVGDISVLVYIPLDGAGGWKAPLASELDAAGSS